MSKLPNPEAMARASASTVAAIEQQLAGTNPSTATSRTKAKPKPSQPRRTPNKGEQSLQAIADKLRSQVSELRAQETRRKENTPTISIGEDRISLDFAGKVAGRPVVAQDPVAIAQNMAMIRPLLQPIISVANGALKGTDFTAPFKFSDERLKAYAKASPLDRATYAYETLFANPNFVQKLSELNEVIEATFQSSGMQPKDVYAVTHDETGAKRYEPKSAVDRLREMSASIEVSTSDKEDDDGPGFP